MKKSTRVKSALEAVRAAKATWSRGLSPAEYKELLEELLADSEGWKMELEERNLKIDKS